MLQVGFGVTVSKAKYNQVLDFIRLKHGFKDKIVAQCPVEPTLHKVKHTFHTCPYCKVPVDVVKTIEKVGIEDFDPECYIYDTFHVSEEGGEVFVAYSHTNMHGGFYTISEFSETTDPSKFLENDDLEIFTMLRSHIPVGRLETIIFDDGYYCREWSND